MGHLSELEVNIANMRGDPMALMVGQILITEVFIAPLATPGKDNNSDKFR
jgi:hypothetical protein